MGVSFHRHLDLVTFRTSQVTSSSLWLVVHPIRGFYWLLCAGRQIEETTTTATVVHRVARKRPADRIDSKSKSYVLRNKKGISAMDRIGDRFSARPATKKLIAALPARCSLSEGHHHTTPTAKKTSRARSEERARHECRWQLGPVVRPRDRERGAPRE